MLVAVGLTGRSAYYGAEARVIGAGGIDKSSMLDRTTRTPSRPDTVAADARGCADGRGEQRLRCLRRTYRHTVTPRGGTGAPAAALRVSRIGCRAARPNFICNSDSLTGNAGATLPNPDPRQPANRCNRDRRLRMPPRFHIRRFPARDAPEPARPLALFEDLVRVTP